MGKLGRHNVVLLGEKPEYQKKLESLVARAGFIVKSQRERINKLEAALAKVDPQNELLDPKKMLVQKPEEVLQ